MTKNGINEITIRKKASICIEKLDRTREVSVEEFHDMHPEFRYIKDEDAARYGAITVTNNMSKLGYLPSAQLFEKMAQSPTLCKQINDQVISILKEQKGADVQYEPMYPNYPSQVMKASDATLFFNQMVHYWSGGTLYPVTEKEDRPELDESVKYKTIDIVSTDNCKAMFSQIVNSSVPYSEQDKKDIETLSKTFDLKIALPKNMVNKENLAFITNFGLSHRCDISDFQKYYKNPTDVMRLANLEHGTKDLTLSSFKIEENISRADRKKYLSLIERCSDIAAEMKVNTNRWKRFGEKLHPGEFQKQFPKAFEAFSTIRDKEKASKVQTFNAKAESEIRKAKEGDIKALSEIQPGILARQLDTLIRNSPDKTAVCDAWENAAKKCAPELLWSVYGHFDKEQNVDTPVKLRTFNTRKDGMPILAVNEDTRENLDPELCERVKVITYKALVEKYKDKPTMGKVYIDPAISECKIPNNTRTANESKSPLASGSRLNLDEEKNTARGFIWWTNIDESEVDNYFSCGRVDLDLSAIVLDDHYAMVSQQYYASGRTEWSEFSGDITNGGPSDEKGVAEFVDVDLSAVKEMGGKYIAFTVHSYTGQNFANIPNARFGYMERECIMSGEIFEPSTVKQCIDLTTKTTSALTCLFDVDKKQVIWVDTPMTNINRDGINNIRTTQNDAVGRIYQAVNSEKPSIETIIKCNVEARGGEIVNSPTEADLIFSLDEGIRPTDLSYFSGELIPENVDAQFLPQEETNKDDVLEYEDDSLEYQEFNENEEYDEI